MIIEKGYINDVDASLEGIIFKDLLWVILPYSSFLSMEFPLTNISL